MSGPVDESGQVTRTDQTVAIIFASGSDRPRSVILHVIVDVNAAYQIIGIEVLNLREQTGARSVGGVRVDRSKLSWTDERIGSVRITFDAAVDAFYCYLQPRMRILTSAPTDAYAHMNDANDLTRLVVIVPAFDGPTSPPTG